MAKLSENQLIILSKASQRADGVREDPAGMKAAAGRIGVSLVAQKLMREIRSKLGCPSGARTSTIMICRWCSCVPAVLQQRAARRIRILLEQAADTIGQNERTNRWWDQLFSGTTASTEDIASAKNLVERHVRFLLPLAFLSPRIVTAIANGSASGGLPVSALARALPHGWSEQEHRLPA